MKFALAAVLFMYIGRRLGWALSKSILYHAPAAVAFLVAIAWGVGVGIAMSSLIGWLQPNPVLKWILGFALAGYVAIPNYGLVDESTVPDYAQPRHTMIFVWPFVAYVITEFLTKPMRAA